MNTAMGIAASLLHRPQSSASLRSSWETFIDACTRIMVAPYWLQSDFADPVTTPCPLCIESGPLPNWRTALTTPDGAALAYRSAIPPSDRSTSSEGRDRLVGDMMFRMIVVRGINFDAAERAWWVLRVLEGSTGWPSRDEHWDLVRDRCKLENMDVLRDAIFDLTMAGPADLFPCHPGGRAYLAMRTPPDPSSLG